MKTLFMFLAIVLFSVSSVFASEGSCVLAADQANANWILYSFECTGDASTGGVGVSSAATISGLSNRAMAGYIVAWDVVPGTGGDAPGAAFDVKLNTTGLNGRDLLVNGGASCSDTTGCGQSIGADGFIEAVPRQVVLPYMGTTLGAGNKATLYVLFQKM